MDIFFSCYETSHQRPLIRRRCKLSWKVQRVCHSACTRHSL